MENPEDNEMSESKDVIGGARIVRPSDPDTYPDPESARVRARQIGCIGIRKYNNRNGGASWMPCTNESDYRKYSGIGYSGRRYRRTQLEREVRRIVGSPSKRKFNEKSANYTNPGLRERIKNRVMAGSRGGQPGQWSARKAQLVAIEYRKAGGGYRGKKSKKQRSLGKWTKEKWRTSDGKPARRGNVTRRYLPAKAWQKLTVGQRAATNRKKIEGSKAGKQFVKNTSAAAKARKRVARGVKHIEFYDGLETKAEKRKIGGKLGNALPGRIGVGDAGSGGRSARRTLSRVNAAVVPYEPKARDADSDLVVQEGTIHERPAVPGVNPIGPAPKPGKPTARTMEFVVGRDEGVAENLPYIYGEEKPDAVTLPNLPWDEELTRRQEGRPLAERANQEARKIRLPKPEKRDETIREARKGRAVAKQPARVQRAKPNTPRREAERAVGRKPINIPESALSEAIRPRADSQVEEVDSATEELQQTARKLGMEAWRAQMLKESYEDFTNQLSRNEKSKIYRMWQDGEV